MRRLVRFAFALVFGSVALAAAVAAVLVWRLQQGPLPLDFLVPRPTPAPAGGDDAWRVRRDGVDLVWQSSAGHAELRARGLRVARPDDSASVRFDEVRIGLRRRALLRGQIEVEAIELHEPDVRLVRDAAGRFGLQVGTPSGETAAPDWLASAL